MVKTALYPRVAPRWSWTSLRYGRIVTRLSLIALCILATAQFVGSYLYLEYPYVNIYRLERGYERLPYQTRLLVVPLYRWADRSPLIVRYADHLARNTYFFPHGVFPGDVLEFFMDIACVLFAGWVTTKIYFAASRRHLLQPLVFPIFLGLCTVTYILHTVQNFRYPYDMPSLAFFAGGFYLIYFRKPVLWFAVLFTIATLNRETILLLLPFYVVSKATATGRFRRRDMFDPSTVAVAGALALYWVGWHHVVFAIFANNSSEYYARVPWNLHYFARLRYYPQIFSTLGFVAPFLFLGRRFVLDPQLRAWLWLIPVWYSVMMVWAVVLETRVFGELIPFVAAFTAVMAEEWLAERLHAMPMQAEGIERPGLIAPRSGERQAA